MNLYEERQKEMMEADDETYWRCDVKKELQQLGNNIPAKATMTTQTCRFISWLCRRSLRMINELEKPEDLAWWSVVHPVGLAECTQCKFLVLAPDINMYKFCPSCGRRIIGITFPENGLDSLLNKEENTDENNS